MQPPFCIKLTESRSIGNWDAILPGHLEKIRLKGTALYFKKFKNIGYIVNQGFRRPNLEFWLINLATDKPNSLTFQSGDPRTIIAYVLDGSFEYRHGNQYSRADKSAVFISPASSINYEIIIEGSSSIMVAFFKGELLRTFRSTFPVADHIESGIHGFAGPFTSDNVNIDDGRLRSLLNQILSTDLNSLEKDRTVISSRDAIISACLDLISFNTIATRLPFRLKQYREQIKNIRKELLNNIVNRNPPLLTDLSVLAGMSEKKLQDIFKSFCGISMFEFFHTARIEAICRNITEFDKSFSEIASEFGYQDYSSFSAAVRKRVGKCPREIRNAQCSEPLTLIAGTN